jgi:hypothetical protein
MTEQDDAPDSREDDEEASATTEENWEAQWYDYGSLPDTVPDFNVALAEFIIKQAGVDESFPSTLRQEGGIRSFERFVKVFTYSIPKLIEILGGKVSIGCEKDIVHCIALALFLETSGNSILGTDLVPEYTDFKQNDWFDYLSDNRRKLTNDFRQQLNTHVLYEENSRKEYAKTRTTNTGSKSSVSTGSVHSTTRSKTARSPTHAAAASPRSKAGTSTPSDFMRNIRNNTTSLRTNAAGGNANAFSNRLQKRSVASQDISWNGKPEKFPELKERVEGHFIQALMGHCVHTDFIAAYLLKEAKVLDEFPEFMLTEEQFRSDNRVMYGALKSIFRHGQAKRHIRAYETQQDGIRAWAAIIQEFDMGGDRDVLIEKYETLLSTKYHRDYAGGITGFVRAYEDAFVELESLEVFYDTKKRLSLMLRNLMVPAQTDWMVSHCEDKYKHDFKEACRWLKGKDARQVFYETNQSTRKANFTSRNDPAPGIAVDHMAFYISQLSLPTLSTTALDSMRNVLLTRNESHYIAPAIWSQLTPDSKQDILRAKLNLPRRNGGDSWESQRQPFKPKAAAPVLAPATSAGTDIHAPGQAPHHYGKTLTKQYGSPEATTTKANQAITDKADTEKAPSESESEGDPEVPSDFEELKNAFMAQRRVFILQTELTSVPVPTINANVDYIERMIGLVQGKDNQFLAVTDNGADTTVMGDGWLILGDIERAPRANLVGFDKDAKKKGLPIISGAIKVRLDDNKSVILRVHQGVYNAGSRTTLISEFQVRNHGLILDSVSAKHRAHVDGDKGTQAFWLSDDQKLPLKVKGGLMTFAFCTPTWDDMEKMEIIDITTEIPWHPIMHSDDPLHIRSMNENAAFKTKKQDPPASKGGG